MILLLYTSQKINNISNKQTNNTNVEEIMHCETYKLKDKSLTFSCQLYTPTIKEQKLQKLKVRQFKLFPQTQHLKEDSPEPMKQEDISLMVNYRLNNRVTIDPYISHIQFPCIKNTKQIKIQATFSGKSKQEAKNSFKHIIYKFNIHLPCHMKYNNQTTKDIISCVINQNISQAKKLYEETYNTHEEIDNSNNNNSEKEIDNSDNNNSEEEIITTRRRDLKYMSKKKKNVLSNIPLDIYCHDEEIIETNPIILKEKRNILPNIPLNMCHNHDEEEEIIETNSIHKDNNVSLQQVSFNKVSHILDNAITISKNIMDTIEQFVQKEFKDKIEKFKIHNYKKSFQQKQKLNRDIIDNPENILHTIFFTKNNNTTKKNLDCIDSVKIPSNLMNNLKKMQLCFDMDCISFEYGDNEESPSDVINNLIQEMRNPNNYIGYNPNERKDNDLYNEEEKIDDNINNITITKHPNIKDIMQTVIKEYEVDPALYNQKHSNIFYRDADLERAQKHYIMCYRDKKLKDLAQKDNSSCFDNVIYRNKNTSKVVVSDVIRYDIENRRNKINQESLETLIEEIWFEISKQYNKRLELGLDVIYDTPYNSESDDSIQSSSIASSNADNLESGREEQLHNEGLQELPQSNNQEGDMEEQSHNEGSQELSQQNNQEENNIFDNLEGIFENQEEPTLTEEDFVHLLETKIDNFFKHIYIHKSNEQNLKNSLWYRIYDDSLDLSESSEDNMYIDHQEEHSHNEHVTEHHRNKYITDLTVEHIDDTTYVTIPGIENGYQRMSGNDELYPIQIHIINENISEKSNVTVNFLSCVTPDTGLKTILSLLVDHKYKEAQILFNNNKENVINQSKEEISLPLLLDNISHETGQELGDGCGGDFISSQLIKFFTTGQMGSDQQVCELEQTVKDIIRKNLNDKVIKSEHQIYFYFEEKDIQDKLTIHISAIFKKDNTLDLIYKQDEMKHIEYDIKEIIMDGLLKKDTVKLNKIYI